MPCAGDFEDSSRARERGGQPARFATGDERVVGAMNDENGTANLRREVEGPRPGQRDACQFPGAAGDETCQQPGKGSPAPPEPDGHCVVQADHGGFQDQGPDSRVLGGGSNGDGRSHGPAPQNGQELVSRADPLRQGVEPGPNVARLSPSERSEGALARPVAAEIEGGDVPASLVQRRHALGLHTARGFREPVKQDRRRSRRFHRRRGIPEPCQHGSVGGPDGDRLRAVFPIAFAFFRRSTSALSPPCGRGGSTRAQAPYSMAASRATGQKAQQEAGQRDEEVVPAPEKCEADVTSTAMVRDEVGSPSAERSP